MKKLKVSELKKHLNLLDKKMLIEMMVEIHKNNKSVQDYFAVKFSGESAVADLVERAKSEIKNEFFPERGHGKLRLAVAKKAISDFKKLTGDEEQTVDLMLYYVELGTEFTATYGDIDLPFYNSMLSMYEKVVDFCEGDSTAGKHLEERLYRVVRMSDGIGWGYHDGLCNLFYSISWLEDE
ncbi:DUF6155 family protein [Sporosarcina cyprini]|uniref:DUF6155 family protein n=1 Tax=Sporosarcina cyprini TaxID=2910523 RepID=UPI001EDEF9B4|nr:DUF6155 family protein [Sporosarcina cyprini]MCG3087289.1 DUF6155 family protein [Sporosarcina cyprini]